MQVTKRERKRIEVGDAEAIYLLATMHDRGIHGVPQDHTKALELYQRATELDHAGSFNNIGYAYESRRGVEIDKKKAKHYYELAAMRGHTTARYALGNMVLRVGNLYRAIKHYMIAVGDGNADSLHMIQQSYSNGKATKEDYTQALRLYQEYLGEIKSAQRDEAAAADEQYRYY